VIPHGEGFLVTAEQDATLDGGALLRPYVFQFLDAHRNRQQAAHPDLTLTGMYNVLEKLKAGEPLSAKEKDIHQQGLVSVLKTPHDEIDRAVLDAYGWSDLVPLMEIVNGNASGRPEGGPLSAPVRAPHQHGGSPCRRKPKRRSRRQLRRREAGWRAAGGEVLVRRMTNPFRRGAVTSLLGEGEV
jgi:hypothetical protein